jgi:hypothetical protein
MNELRAGRRYHQARRIQITHSHHTSSFCLVSSLVEAVGGILRVVNDKAPRTSHVATAVMRWRLTTSNRHAQTREVD